MSKLSPLRRGFTLIELLLVIAIVAILAAIVFVLANPSEKEGTKRNNQRQSDVTTILNTVYSYAIDHAGAFPVEIPLEIPKQICLTGKPLPTCANLDVLTKPYLMQIPYDPLVKESGTGTLYTIVKSKTGRITVTSLAAEEGVPISMTR